MHPKVDGWLLGGLGLVAWGAVSPQGFGGSLSPIGGVLSGLFLTIAAMHFGASYHLAYGDGVRSLRRHPVALVGVPVAILGVSAAVVAGQSAGHGELSAQGLRVLLVAVFTLTGWHYVKQAYGIAMLSARGAGLRPSKRQTLILRYGLYPVWLYNVLEIYGQGRSATYQAYDVSVPLVPSFLNQGLEAVAIGSLGAALVVMVRLGLQAGVRPPLGLWGTYVAGGLWFIWPPSYISAAVVLGGLHGVQYLACAHRAEIDLAVERRDPHLLHRWLCVFGGAAAGGVLLTTWLPDFADAAVVSPSVPGMLGALIFAGFNLHHYAVDAVIWRSGGDHVVRMSRGPQLGVNDDVPGQPALAGVVTSEPVLA